MRIYGRSFRLRLRQKIVFACGLLLLVVYIVVCWHAGLATVLELETENLANGLPYRYADLFSFDDNFGDRKIILSQEKNN